jgi:serine/threonine-protein kinase HipA
MRFDELYLWFMGNPAQPRYVGQLRRVDAGKGVSLHYGQDWLANGFPLSEDLPLVNIEHLPRWQGMAVGAVDDARPDSWGERVIQYLDKPARLSLMEYLYFAGDDRFGALGVSTSSTEYRPRPRGPLPRLEQAQALSEIAHKISAKEPVSDIERRLMAAGGSFGGAKPKALIEIAGEQWILKFFDGEPIDVPLVEHASMLLAHKAGIRVAETRLVPLAGAHALAVRRYDRAGNQRIHCISAGTALRAETVAGQEPSFGYPQLALLLRRAGVTEAKLGEQDSEQDRHELFRRMIFNILMDNTDDHGKNHALFVLASTQHGRFRLTPAYDVLPTNSGQGRQEFIVGLEQRDSTLDNAMSQCELFGSGRQQAANEIARIVDVVNAWKVHFAEQGVTAADIESLAEHVDGDALRSQRMDFKPATHAAPAKPSRRKSPFSS